MSVINKATEDLKIYGVSYTYLLFGKIPIRLNPLRVFVYRPGGTDVLRTVAGNELIDKIRNGGAENGKA